MRLNKSDYENNAKANLQNATVYQEVNQDTTDVINNIKNEVETQVDKMVNNGEMRQKTAEYILGGGDKPGVYYENLKTH